jgi:hypothetical protein
MMASNPVRCAGAAGGSRHVLIANCSTASFLRGFLFAGRILTHKPRGREMAMQLLAMNDDEEARQRSTLLSIAFYSRACMPAHRVSDLSSCIDSAATFLGLSQLKSRWSQAQMP